MILKVIDVYASNNQDLVNMVNNLYVIGDMKLNSNLDEKQKARVVDLWEKQNEIFAKLLNTNKVCVPFIREAKLGESEKETVVIYKLDYIQDSSIYAGWKTISEDGGKSVTHVEVVTL